MDQVILDIAKQFNSGHLRVDWTASVPNIADPRRGMYFAPGIDGNPLVPSSNPAFIATTIKGGDYDEATRSGRWAFAEALLVTSRISVADYETILAMQPTKRPVAIESDTVRTRTWHRTQDDAGNVAHEFISMLDEQVAQYNVVRSEVHDFSTTYQYRLNTL